MPNHVHLIAVPKPRTACGVRSAKRIDVIRGGSISAKNGAAIYGRGVRFVHHGRTLSVGGGALRGVESRCGQSWWTVPAMALEAVPRRGLSGRDDRLVKVRAPSWRWWATEAPQYDLASMGSGSLRMPSRRWINGVDREVHLPTEPSQKAIWKPLRWALPNIVAW